MLDLYYLLIVVALAVVTWLLAEAFARLSQPTGGSR
jgi:hypothetical protein